MKNGAGFRGGKAFGVFATMALVLFPASIFASCGSSKSPQPGTTSTTSSSVNNTLPPNTSAGALLRGSLAAAERSGSFTFDMYEASGKSGHTLSLLIKGDVTMSGGAMTFESSSSGNLEAVLSGGKLYFKGNALALTKQMTFSKSSALAYAGRWILAKPSSSSMYKDAFVMLKLPTFLQQVLPTAPLKLVGATSIGGVSDEGISGSLGSIFGTGKGATEILYVRQGSNPLPVELVVNVSVPVAPPTGSSPVPSSTSLKYTSEVVSKLTFTNWGEKNTVLPALSGAVACASIPSCTV